MAQRKAVLVSGCAEGPWVSTKNLLRPRLRIEGPQGTMVAVEQRLEDRVLQMSLPPGTHNLYDSLWTRTCVAEGEASSVSCFVEGD